MDTIKFTADEKMDLFSAIQCKIVQTERYIETRKELVECGCAPSDDKFLRDSEEEIKKLTILANKVLNWHREG